MFGALGLGLLDPALQSLDLRLILVDQLLRSFHLLPCALDLRLFLVKHLPRQLHLLPRAFHLLPTLFDELLSALVRLLVHVELTLGADTPCFLREGAELEEKCEQGSQCRNDNQHCA